MQFLKKHIFLIIILVFVFLTGCKTYQPVTMPAKPDVAPEYGHAGKDSSSIADFSWKQYFKDPLLLALIDTALTNNPDLLIAIQRNEIAKAYLLKARGALTPSLNAVVSAGFDKFGDYTMNGVGNFDTNLSPNVTSEQKIPTNPTPDYFIGLTSSWEIDIWGKLRNRRKAAIARLLATESGRRYVVTSIVSQIAQAYYSLLALDNELRIISRNSRLQADALEIVKVQKEGGRATELAVQQFEAQLFHTRSVEYDVKQRIIQVEATINYILGRYQQPIMRDSTAFLQPIPESLQAGIPSGMMEKRPDIQQALHELEAAEADVLAARAAYLPSFVITPYVGFNTFTASKLFDPASLVYGIAGSLTAPLWNRNEIKTDYAIANAQNREAVFNYRKAVVNGFNEVVTTLSHIENTKQVTNLKKNEVLALQKAVASSNDLYLAGYATYLEVITAQKSVLEAELELNNASRNLLLQSVDIYRALGGGWQ